MCWLNSEFQNLSWHSLSKQLEPAMLSLRHRHHPLIRVLHPTYRCDPQLSPPATRFNNFALNSASNRNTLDITNHSLANKYYELMLSWYSYSCLSMIVYFVNAHWRLMHMLCWITLWCVVLRNLFGLYIYGSRPQGPFFKRPDWKLDQLCLLFCI